MISRLSTFQRLCQIRTIATSTATHKDVNSLTLYVSNLPWTVSNRELQNYFSQFGPVSSASVIFDEQTGLSRGYGYVNFNYSKSYVKALQAEPHSLEGKRLDIGQAKHSNKKWEGYIDEAFL